MTLIHKEMLPDVASTFINIYRQQGKLPVWHLMDSTLTVYSPPLTGTSKEEGVTLNIQLELSGVRSVTVMVSVTSRHR